MKVRRLFRDLCVGLRLCGCAGINARSTVVEMLISLCSITALSQQWSMCHVPHAQVTGSSVALHTIAFMQSCDSCKRIRLWCLCCAEEAYQVLRKKGITAASKKVHLLGYSAVFRLSKRQHQTLTVLTGLQTCSRGPDRHS